MSQRAYFDSPLSEFLVESADSIIGKITQNHPQQLERLQTGAWQVEIDVLKKSLEEFQSGHIFLEFLIPRMGRRADVVFVQRGIIFVIEFKVDAKTYGAADVRQAHGYAIDLSYFHEGSHDRVLVPILVATDATPNTSQWKKASNVYEPLRANSSNLDEVIRTGVEEIGEQPELDGTTWANTAYKPTPTIIEAAQALYAQHDVTDISRNDAGAQNLNATSKTIAEIVHDSRKNKRKTICFVTGVPGAGKTLVGLNIATSKADEKDVEHAVFLSGNGPLVAVLREALARDDVARGVEETKADARRKAESFIQNIHHFRDDALTTQHAPVEHVVVFDEAQRAWDLHHTSKFMKQKKGQRNFEQSEPDFLIGVMDRHMDWAVIIALVGGGQEINNGEAGLDGWLDALRTRFATWDVFYSDKLSQAEYAGGDVSLDSLPNAICQSKSSLHLSTSMRSFRAENLSHMVYYLVDNQPGKAAEFYEQFSDRFPIRLTRDLAAAKQWIRSQSRANETKGVIASSGGIRLKTEGIFVKNRLSAADWFLNDQDDVRSCHFLEDVATEFDIQGLELDWCLVGWDADYRYQSGKFEHWKFSGTRWLRCHQDARQRFLENAYRVLLTRARQGMIIFVPKGANSDPTRLPSFYDGTFGYLKECGIPVM